MKAKYKWKQITGTVVISSANLHWDKYYAETGDSTTYWFAVGHKPTIPYRLAEITRRQHKHIKKLMTEQILERAYALDSKTTS